MIEGGMSVEQVQNRVNGEAFWKAAKMVYKEVKGFITIKIG